MRKSLAKRRRENLEAENDFIKMKMMLEFGAQFESVGDLKPPPEIENMFLNNIMEIEKRLASANEIELFDKIGRPDFFRKPGEIPDHEMEGAWLKLLEHLHRYGVDICVCSPNVSARELYRFAVEELFRLEVNELEIPGMVHAFIYDDFHPDPVFENTRNAEEELLPGIFQTKNLLYDFFFDTGELHINDKSYSHFGSLKARVEKFKSCFDLLKLEMIQTHQVKVNKKTAETEGFLKVNACMGSLQTQLKGNWKIKSILNPQDYWVAKQIWLEGIDL